MLTINLVTETYEYPEDLEDMPDEPTDADIRTATVGLRELVRLMRDYSEPSCYPSRGETFEWLSRTETDYRSGADIVESIHFARENPSRNARYWRIAMRAAGFVR